MNGKLFLEAVRGYDEHGWTCFHMGKRFALCRKKAIMTSIGLAVPLPWCREHGEPKDMSKYTRATKVHFRSNDVDNVRDRLFNISYKIWWATCGRDIYSPEFISDNPDEVTCGTCRKTRAFRALAVSETA